MSKFITGSVLNDKLEDIIWNAKEYLLVLSPYVKLDTHVKKIFDKVKVNYDVHFVLIFGKNEHDKGMSMKLEDFNYFSEFNNITILYNKDLHAKYYSNEKEGLITSMNLHEFSMLNNIEYGVNFNKNILNPTEKIYDEVEAYNKKLILNNSDVIFYKMPLFKKSMMGLKRKYMQSVVLFDVAYEFFNNQSYEKKHLAEFKDTLNGDLETVFKEKPKRENSKGLDFGYCIRTGEKIPFNPAKPLSYYAYRTWVQFGNVDYQENYCHKTGQKSYGKTSVRNPILK